MSWETLLKNPARKRPKVRDTGDVSQKGYVLKRNSYMGKILLRLSDDGLTDGLLKKVKDGEYDAGSVRRAVNKLKQLFNTPMTHLRIAFEEVSDDIQVPVQSTVLANADKILDELPASRHEKGSGYKQVISKNSIKKYRDFMKGNHQQLIDFLKQGTADAKKWRHREIRRWNDENNNEIVKYLKGAKANKDHLMGYDTEGITLKLAELPPNPVKKGVKEIPEGFEISLGSFMSIGNGSKYRNGEPSLPIKRNFFARLFKQPKYRTKTVATVVEGVNVQEVSDDIAREYLGLVLHRLTGVTRNQFLPEISNMEDMSKIYGTKASAKASTGKLLPALEYILKNSTFQLEGKFAKEKSKGSLQKKSVIDALIDEQYSAEYPDLQKLFNSVVKPAPSARRKESVKETPKDDIHARREMEQFVKLLEDNPKRQTEFNKLVEDTVVRRYAMLNELRETLLVTDEDDVNIDLIDSEGLNHIFDDEEDVIEMDEDMRAAIERMEPSKVKEGTHHEPLPSDIEILKPLFTESITDAYSGLMEELREMTQDDRYTMHGRISQSKLRQEMEKMDTNVLDFKDVVFLLGRMERVLLGKAEISKKIRIIFRKMNRSVEDVKEAEEALKTELSQQYPNIRNEFVSKLKEKIGEVLSEPIMHDKKGFQPYTWLTEDKGIGA